MEDLIAWPFTLSQGEDVVAIVTAVNVIGASAPSEPNSLTANIALVRVVPHKPPTTPHRDNINTSASLLQVTIDELVSP